MQIVSFTHPCLTKTVFIFSLEHKILILDFELQKGHTSDIKA